MPVRLLVAVVAAACLLLPAAAAARPLVPADPVPADLVPTGSAGAGRGPAGPADPGAGVSGSDGSGAGGSGSAGPAPAPAWGWPLAGTPPVTRSFDRLPHPYAAGHRGVDLAGSPEAPVLAAGDGVVAFAGWVAGRPLLSIDHAGGLRTTYQPVEPSVAAGLPVARGFPIGVLLAGHPGCSVEACLHWGLRRGEAYLDPVSLLEAPRVRLFPVRRATG
ncbi:M23 family metallopeptidase [Geodermatophilus sp. YIM 151500]|uniref:M23 family metallopeptidase n=1 Tax=Geodermatophilus sp. YIM 151500 TaxID=2984531 RepID=UPI0021E4E881|nr:M23 family metallopeptidase [Geodermatophilus sp. YIM 151500]MCV2488972.1 M23 family metallopeptidase [Geodermatophilus sp. YIM 151500]